MKKIISESVPSNAVVKFAKLLIVVPILACAVIAVVNPASLLLLVLLLLLMYAILHFYVFRSVTRIELEPSTGKLSIIRGEKVVWSINICEIESVNTLPMKYGTLVILNFGQGKSFSFSFIGFTAQHFKELQEWVVNSHA